MISYKPFFDLMARKDINRKWLMRYKILGQSTLEKMRDNKPIDLKYIEKLCNIFHCHMRDIVEVDCDD